MADHEPRVVTARSLADTFARAEQIIATKQVWVARVRANWIDDRQQREPAAEPRS